MEDSVTVAMTRQEREMFLAGLHVGIISVPEEGRGPLTVPVWYAYEPGGDLRIITGRSSRKRRLLEKVRRFSLCVQTESPPYKYVSVEGPIVGIDGSDVERDLRPLARRYLGTEAGDRYVQTTREEHTDNVLVRMRPERWLAVDFGKARNAHREE
jgi:nitroimidazol reductase NimA-like FMN-containing flavoprotein (pyridoxamine 5'-phosphate oxidase superfamily)